MYAKAASFVKGSRLFVVKTDKMAVWGAWHKC